MFFFGRVGLIKWGWRGDLTVRLSWEGYFGSGVCALGGLVLVRVGFWMESFWEGVVWRPVFGVE